MRTYAIVGFGTAGYHALKAIRRLDAGGTVDVYTNTGLAPYNPMLTTYYAGGKLSYREMFPFGSLEEIQKTCSLLPSVISLKINRLSRVLVAMGCIDLSNSISKTA